MLLRNHKISAPSPFKRFISGATKGYSSKVRALPFAVAKHQAIQQIAPYASLFTFTAPLRDLFARLIPGAIEPLQPIRIQPLYFPCWFIDAEIQGSTWLKYMGPAGKSTAAVDLSRSYLPGFPFEPICRLSLNAPNLEKLRTLPFTPELAKLHGEEIACIPYSISPTSALNLARLLPEDKGLIDQDMCFSPSSLKPNLLAAYPVLFPLYLAQYELKEPLSTFNPGSTLQVLLEAHVPEGRLSVCPVYPPNLPDIIARDEVVSFRDFTERTFAPSDYDSDTSITASYQSSFPNFQVKVAKWLDGLITQPGAAAKLAEVSDIPAVDGEDAQRFWDQPWIREWDVSDIRKNRSFIQQGHTREAENREKPDWWKEWEASQGA
ncbi:hypothetical protein PC9H_009931 [Pleurotus ostreatus]|uniref:Uncharacterized protein n=1 Tax=Pleurotus ostreatus TaxID=5322 RepID=A0A8H6ZMR0_PLEOS|nr:uncharacterized protein PC9H_009931 [Pleurotus ostreatus]KAF7424623.1 hypothetical protein PC9H_009931 [Pleurotus ostreatus]KAJ8692403.1 hypothetical protein PTI98_009719 [Pleurotus ostreatus]